MSENLLNVDISNIFLLLAATRSLRVTRVENCCTFNSLANKQSRIPSQQKTRVVSGASSEDSWSGIESNP